MDRDTTSLVVSAALVLSILISRVLFRGRPKISPELDATLDVAMKLEKTDPAAGEKLLDSHFMREAAVEEERREELRQRAVHDLDAALELRGRLQEDLKTNAFARKDIVKNVPEPKRTLILSQIDASDRDLQTELAQLATTINGLERH